VDEKPVCAAAFCAETDKSVTANNVPKNFLIIFLPSSDVNLVWRRGSNENRSSAVFTFAEVAALRSSLD
jgi:hypothetical protein